MEAIITFLLFAALLVVFSVFGAYLPRSRKMDEERIHELIAVSAGLFLGLLLLILIPEGMEESEEAGISGHYAMMVLAAAFLLIMVVESYITHNSRSKEDLNHNVGTLGLYVGLGIHAICDGLILAALFMAGETVGLMAAIGLCIHKFADMFSLSSVTLMDGGDNSRVMKELIAFALITPIAGIVFLFLFGDMELEGTLGLPLMFASGTMLYVTTCDILPEAFHEGKELKSVGLVSLGVILMILFFVIFPHFH